MKPECVKQVEEHLSKVRGKAVKLTDNQIEAIDKRMNKAARDIRRRDPKAWQNMTADERTAAMGVEAANAGERAADARVMAKLWQERKRITARDDLVQIANTAKRDGGTAGSKEKYPHVKAMMKLMQQTDRQKANAVAGIQSQLSDLWGQTANKFRALPFLDDKEADNTLIKVFREMRGEDTTDAGAKALASGVAKIFSDLRDRLNEFGANIDRIDNYVPQDHNAGLVTKAGRDTWVNDTYGYVDKNSFVDADGNQLGDAEIKNILGDMWETITTNGRSKKEYNEDVAQIEGPIGDRSVMQRASSFTRQIHFKDAAAHEAYHAKYSEMKPAALLLQHLQRSAEDLAIVERFGPDAKQNIAKLIDVAHHLDDSVADKLIASGAKKVSKERGKRTIAGVNPEQLAEALVGREDDYHSMVVDAARWLSSMHTATKLTRTALRAVPQDLNTIITYGRELGVKNKLPELIKASTDGATRETLRRMGIGAGIIEQSLMSTGRRVSGMGWLGQGGMDRFANATMHLTGLQQWTNSASRSGQLIHAMHLADHLGKDFAKLEIGTKQLLSEVGINETNWPLVQKAPVMDIGGMKIPDINGISKLGLAPREHNELSRLVGAFITEGGNKVTNERDLLARTAGRLGATPGTTSQAVIQSMMMFRGVVSVITANFIRRWQRQATLGGKLAVTGSYMGGATMAGYVGNSMVNLMDGKDMQDPSDLRTWGAAFTTGGGAGFFGDMIASGFGQVAESQTGGASDMWRTLGPTGSEIGDMFDITRATVKAISTGEDKDAGKAAFKAVRFARNHVPLANLWYTKTAIDHLFMNDINEAVMPGYKKKMEGLAGKYGNQYWWSPSGNVTAPGFGEFKE